jgi:hypothetical protein
MLVIGEAAEVSAMDPSLRPTCPIVVVPAGSIPAADAAQIPNPRT